jgi:hypothetical protein
MELKQSSCDPCLFFNLDKQIFLGIYVDDLIIVGNDSHWILEKLREKLKLSDMGECKDLLGLRMSRFGDTLHLSQPGFVDKLSSAFAEDLPDDSVPTPMRTDFNPIAESSPFDKQRYLSMVGALQWIATCTRPDVSSSVNLLSRFQSKPTKNLWRAGLRIVKYLGETRNFGITFTRNSGQIQTYTDASWGNNYDGRSISGYIVIGSGPIAFRSKTQSTVALSSAEAEMIALSLGAAEVEFVRKLERELNRSELTTWNVFCDNKAAVDISRSPRCYTKLKHVALRHFYIQHLVERQELHVRRVKSAEQVADGLTKNLDRIAFERSRDRMGVRDWRDFRPDM